MEEKKTVVKKRFTDTETKRTYRPGNYFEGTEERIKDLQKKGYLGHRIGQVSTNCEGVVVEVCIGVSKIIDDSGRKYLLARPSFSHLTAQEHRHLTILPGDVVRFNFLTGQKYPDVYVAVDVELTPYVRAFSKSNGQWRLGDRFWRNRLGTWKGRHYHIPKKNNDPDDKRYYEKALVKEDDDEEV